MSNKRQRTEVIEIDIDEKSPSVPFTSDIDEKDQQMGFLSSTPLFKPRHFSSVVELHEFNIARIAALSTKAKALAEDQSLYRVDAAVIAKAKDGSTVTGFFPLKSRFMRLLLKERNDGEEDYGDTESVLYTVSSKLNISYGGNSRVYGATMIRPSDEQPQRVVFGATFNKQALFISTLTPNVVRLFARDKYGMALEFLDHMGLMSRKYDWTTALSPFLQLYFTMMTVNHVVGANIGDWHHYKNWGVRIADRNQRLNYDALAQLVGLNSIQIEVKAGDYIPVLYDFGSNNEFSYYGETNLKALKRNANKTEQQLDRESMVLGQEHVKWARKERKPQPLDHTQFSRHIHTQSSGDMSLVWEFVFQQWMANPNINYGDIPKGSAWEHLNSRYGMQSNDLIFLYRLIKASTLGGGTLQLPAWLHIKLAV